MKTMTLTYKINVVLEDGTIKTLSKTYTDEAKAETNAFYILGIQAGVQTAQGIVVGTQVVDSDGNVLCEFEA